MSFKHSLIRTIDIKKLKAIDHQFVSAISKNIEKNQSSFYISVLKIYDNVLMHEKHNRRSKEKVNGERILKYLENENIIDLEAFFLLAVMNDYLEIRQFDTIYNISNWELFKRIYEVYNTSMERKYLYNLADSNFINKWEQMWNYIDSEDGEVREIYDPYINADDKRLFIDYIYEKGEFPKSNLLPTNLCLYTNKYLNEYGSGVTDYKRIIKEIKTNGESKEGWSVEDIDYLETQIEKLSRWLECDKRILSRARDYLQKQMI